MIKKNKISLLLSIVICSSLNAGDNAGGRLLVAAAQGLYNYPTNLQKRREKPATKEDFHKAIDVQFEHFLKSKDPADLHYTLKGGYKKTWADHNPGWYDLMWVGGAVAIFAILVALAPAPNPGGDGAPAAQAGGNFGGQGYQLGGVPDPDAHAARNAARVRLDGAAAPLLNPDFHGDDNPPPSYAAAAAAPARLNNLHLYDGAEA